MKFHKSITLHSKRLSEKVDIPMKGLSQPRSRRDDENNLKNIEESPP